MTSLLLQTDIAKSVCSYSFLPSEKQKITSDTRSVFALLNHIKKANGDIQLLKQMHDQFIPLTRNWLNESIPLPTILTNINDYHDAIMYQILSDAETQMVRDGWGPPPAAYCWVLLGSGGRREQTLWTDQDNAIIYDDAPSISKTKSKEYFQKLGQLGVNALYQTGYPLCTGNVMASNGRWCKSITDWKADWHQWVSCPSIDHLRYFLIASDFRFIFGNQSLATQIQNWFSDYISQQKQFLLRLSRHSLVHPIPIGLFGQLFVEQWGPTAGRFDLKNSIYVQLVNCIRLWSLQYGISSTNTVDRLRQLVQIPEDHFIWTTKQSEQWLDGFFLIFQLRLLHHISLAEKKQELDNLILLEDLTHHEKKGLKIIMKKVKRMRFATEKHFARLAGDQR